MSREEEDREANVGDLKQRLLDTLRESGVVDVVKVRSGGGRPAARRRGR